MAQIYLSITILITQTTHPKKLHQNKCWFKMREKKTYTRGPLREEQRANKPNTNKQ